MTTMRGVLWAAVLVGTGGCRVAMEWVISPGVPSSCDGDAPEDVYAVGSRVEVRATDPHEHADVTRWSFEVDPPGFADLEASPNLPSTLRAELRVRQAGHGRIEVHRTHGFQADEHALEAATPAEVDVATGVDARTDGPRLPFAVHLIDDRDVPFHVGGWRDEEGRALRSDDLLRVRASGAVGLAGSGDAGFSLGARTLGAGRVQVLAFDREIVSFPVEVHATSEITGLSIVGAGVEVADTGDVPARADQLVAHVHVGAHRAHGATLTWYQDGATLGHDEVVEVFGTGDADGEAHLVTVCLGDPGPPVGDTGDSDPPDEVGPIDTAPVAETEVPVETDAPGEGRDTDRGEGADSGAVADTDTVDTDTPAPRRRPAARAADGTRCARVRLATGTSIDPSDQLEVPCTFSLGCGRACAQAEPAAIGWFVAVLGLALRRRRGPVVVRSGR